MYHSLPDSSPGSSYGLCADNHGHSNCAIYVRLGEFLPSLEYRNCCVFSLHVRFSEYHLKTNEFHTNNILKTLL
jgi:hypothetical protein